MTDKKRLRELAEAATQPGPWDVGPYYNRDAPGVGPIVHDVEHVNSDVVVAEHVAKHDAAFIAAANPTAVLELLDENERLHALTLNPGATLHGSTIDEIAAERDSLRAALKEACEIAMLYVPEAIHDGYNGGHLNSDHVRLSALRKLAGEP